jgi:hypothetical protein
MEKKNIFVLSILGLVILGLFLSFTKSSTSPTITTSKTIIYKKPNPTYNVHYVNTPNVSMSYYNPYKAQYYN